jgi:hypothetical protein
MNEIASFGPDGNIFDPSPSNAVKGRKNLLVKGDFMQMQIEGQEITYKDLPDLRGKLTDLLATIAQEREAHNHESARLGRQEKKIRKFLGDDSPSPAVKASAADRTEGAGKGGTHE